MNEKRELIELLENYIKHIKKMFEKNNPLTLDEATCFYLSDSLDKINDNYKELINFDLSQIKKLFPSFNDWQIELLEYFQTIIRDTNFSLYDDDTKMLESVIINLQSRVEEYTKEINEFKSSNTRELEKLIKPYQNIINKLNNGNGLSSLDVQAVYTILKQSNKKTVDSIKIMRYLFNTSLKTDVLFKVEENKEPEIVEEDEIEIIDTVNMSYETLRNLFIKYGLYFNKFSDEEQIQIQKFGNLARIEEIIKKFMLYGVKLSDYLDTRSAALVNIFLYSNASIVEDLLEKFTRYGIIRNENGILDIDVLLERPSRFINRRKKWAKRKPGENTIDNIEGVAGCYEDVMKNLEYFSNQGLYIPAAYVKSGCYFDLPHEHVLNVVKTFELYDIDKKYYLKTLSCFNTKHQADSIDLFIELGYLDYLKNNMSRILKVPTSPIFYKLSMANRLGITPQIYGKVMDGNITFDNREYLGIGRHNGAEVTNQYVFEFDGREYCDEIINSKVCNKINVVSEAQKSLISLLDKEYMVLDENGYPTYRLYDIGGVMLSRYKFLRIYNALIINGVRPSLNSILYSLTKNSIITKEEFDIVFENISNIYNELSSKRGVSRK